MKKYSILYLLFFLFALTGCEKETVSYIDPAGDYAVNFSFPEEPVMAPAKVVLVNRSKYSDRYEWQFQDAKLINADGEVYEATNSTAIVPDTLFYELTGTYTVTLTAWQGNHSEAISKDVVIGKMQPVIEVPENIGVFLDVTFSAEAFQYPGQPLSYSWDFGEAGTSTEASPTVQFITEGEHTVTLTINDGQETLTASVQIYVMGELTTSLYFTDVRTGRLYRYAFKELSEPTVESFNVRIGVHPLAMQVHNNRLFISDAGNHLTFSTQPADGRIFSVDMQGGDERVLGYGVGTYVQDPFNFVIDPASNMLFYTTRNNNVRSVPVNSQNIELPTTQRMGIVAANADVSSVFGWVDGGIQLRNGELWYSKQANGWGLYRFNIATNAFVSRIQPFDNFSIRSFIFDNAHGKIYFVLNNPAGTRPAGLYKANIDGSSIELVDPLTGFSPQGVGTEIASITSLAIETDADGYLYYPFRAATDVNAAGAVVGSGAQSGVKRYKLDGSESPDFLVQGHIPYGIALDLVKR